MSKKQLLSESEIRRFMTLANLDTSLANGVIKENYSVGENSGEKPEQEELEEVYAEDSVESPSEEGEETLDLVGSDGDSGEISPMVLQGLKMMIKGATGKDVDISVDGSEEEMPSSEEEPEGSEEPEEPEETEETDDSEDSKEPSDSEEDDESEESELEESEDLEEEKMQELRESFVQNVLERVSARLVSEASKAKAKGEKVLKKQPKKEPKKTVAQKMKQMRDKKKVNEANAPAPKATNSNGPKKGAGSATKGNWGVTSKVSSQEWKAGKGSGGHELETVSASAEHIVSHGKANLATKGKK